MAYPTGSGSERLMRGAIDGQTDDATTFKFDGTSPTMGVDNITVPANHIITVLSVVVCDQTDSPQLLHLQVNNGAVTCNLLQSQAIAALQTFVFSEKVVLQGGDWMKIQGDSGSNYDVWYTYIDQDWS